MTNTRPQKIKPTYEVYDKNHSPDVSTAVRFLGLTSLEPFIWDDYLDALSVPIRLGDSSHAYYLSAEFIPIIVPAVYKNISYLAWKVDDLRTWSVIIDNDVKEFYPRSHLWTVELSNTLVDCHDLFKENMEHSYAKNAK